MLSVSPAILRESKERVVFKVIAERNRWLIANLLILLVILMELKYMYLFHLLALPQSFLVMYSTSVAAACTFCGLSALGHLVFICHTSTHLIWRRWSTDKRNADAATSFDSGVDSALNNRDFLGPTVFSSLNSPTESSAVSSSLHNFGFSGSRQLQASVIHPFGLDVSSRPAPGQPVWTKHPSSGSILVGDNSTHCLNRSPDVNPRPVSLLDFALSPIVGPPLHTESGLCASFGKITQPAFVNMTLSNMPPTWNTVQTYVYQYQTSSPSPSSPKCGSYNDDLATKSPTLITQSPRALMHSPSDIVFGDPRHTRPGICDPVTERNSYEYWKEHGITEAQVEQYVVALRKWLHGTIFRRLVDQIATINRHLSETSGSDVLIGSVTLNTLQELCSTKYQYLPSLPILLSFLELMKDHGYLVNRLKELARGCCLEEFRWDSGSRSSSWPWKEHLPNDSLILLHMFATYMDLRMPPHPKCPAGRVFSQLCIVRYPDKPDLQSRYNTQLYQINVQPPHFKLVLDGKMYTIPAGPKNLFQAMVMFFHHSFNVDGKFRSVSLGPSGLNVAWIFSK
ncbi:unnamed protein product [Dicrocoelium dendriticum]|nr:unnamed protein product [Dicrocoelium dendriticum]